MRARIPAIVLVTGMCGAVGAQPGSGTWFFGFGGSIAFQGGAVTTSAGALFTQEGCASLCDAAGDPLFFTNGEVVIARNSVQMPNGFGLAGSFSSTQSAVVVPFPDDPDRYYIFTTPAMAGAFSPLGITGLAFSIVDMSLNNGFGDVTVKNQVLTGAVTEKLTAVRHANGRDIWVVAHAWDSADYFAFLVTCGGAIEGPVTSTAGRVMPFLPGPDPVIPLYASVGAMDISPDGSTLAATWATVQDGNIGGSSFLDILHFNDTTGVVSDWLAITHPGNGAVLDVRGYGMAFSPAGSKLYQTEFGRLGFPGQGIVRQYDMTAADIPASEFIVTQSLPEAGLVQAAPDGTMLIALLQSDSLAGIHFPEVAGAGCGFDPSQVQLSAGSSMWGLPNDWDPGRSDPPADPLGLADTTLQCGDTLFLRVRVVANPFEAVDVLWSTGATTVEAAIPAPGAYWVRAIMGCDTLTDAFTVEGSGPADLLGADIRACAGDPVELAAPDIPGLWTWSTGDTGHVITVDATGHYRVDLVDSLGCHASDSLEVTFENCRCRVFVPNAFTPNGDDINDGWKAEHDCLLEAFRLTVFDRWGRVLFDADDDATAWNGATAGEDPLGVYSYLLTYTFWNGHDDERRSVRGSVTLVR